jgi:predicted dehydrogenase
MTLGDKNSRFKGQSWGVAHAGFLWYSVGGEICRFGRWISIRNHDSYQEKSMDISRREFITSVSMLAAGAVLPSSLKALTKDGKKLKVVMVGTGVRGISFWGKRIVEQYPEIIEYVGLCDINPGRVEYARQYMGMTCPVFTDFTEMVSKTKPDLIIVTTVDATHDEFIIQGLKMGCDILTEKPMTTDEKKCKAILEAERKSKNKVIVGFNYRWGPYMTEIKKLLAEKTIGDITSVDFHWMLNTDHGASYFRRWHGLKQCSGSLWCHKATHHFDLLNWWLDSDPVQVSAYGALEFYGAANKFRGKNCRTCEYKQTCKFYWDITKDPHLVKLYCDNEKYDGYVRDSCLFRPEINIYDKMSAQIKYANNAVVNYSLTTYSPYEGWKIAFNGKDGRVEAWQDIPYFEDKQIDQEKLHALEMQQGGKEEMTRSTVIVHKLWSDYKKETIAYEKTGHGGGDKRMHDKIFANPAAADPYKTAAGTRDGALSLLIGVAARKSIDANKPVNIADLTDIKLSPNRA